MGTDDVSLIGQLRLAQKKTILARLDGLEVAQVDALEKLSELSSKALIEALRDVIRDFNQKLSDQFGDNFKQIRDVVAKPLRWQEIVYAGAS